MGDEAVVLVAAGAFEADAVDDGMRGAFQPLERPERAQRDATLAHPRTRERVPAGYRVVHAEVVIGMSDGKTLGLVLHQGEGVAPGEPLAAAEEREVDHEVDPDHLPAE